MQITESNQILRPAAAAKMLGISKATLWRWVKSGAIKPPRRLGARARGFTAGDLAAFIEGAAR